MFSDFCSSYVTEVPRYVFHSTIPFIFRLVHCGKQLSLTSGMDVHIFSTRTGTKQGVESHTFRVETQRDQTVWSKALVSGAHQAAQIIQQVNCGELRSVLL